MKSIPVPVIVGVIVVAVAILFFSMRHYTAKSNAPTPTTMPAEALQTMNSAARRGPVGTGGANPFGGGRAMTSGGQ